jgi:hypothetical protein
VFCIECVLYIQCRFDDDDLLLFLQKQNLASAIYLCGLGTRLLGKRNSLSLSLLLEEEEEEEEE